VPLFTREPTANGMLQRIVNFPIIATALITKHSVLFNRMGIAKYLFMGAIALQAKALTFVSAIHQ
jgi:hypothetical protein